MLIGQFQHNIDEKGRISLPAKFREHFSGQIVLAKGIADECVCVYTMEEWKGLIENLGQFPKIKFEIVTRALFSSACELSLDKQGRMVIPSLLRKYAGLEKEAVIIGFPNKVEIWNKEKLDAVQSQQSLEDIKQLLMEAGF